MSELVKYKQGTTFPTAIGGQPPDDFEQAMNRALDWLSEEWNGEL